MEISNEQKITIIGLVVAVLIGGIFYFYNHFLNPEKPSLLLNEPKQIFESTGEREIIVHVCGAVQWEGVYKMHLSDRVVNAIRIAGGPKTNAELSSINLAEELKDGQKIFIPEKIKPIIEAVAPKSSGNQKNPVGSLTNINSANEKELDDLPGIGPTTARKIIEARPFSKIEDLLKIERFGKSRLEKIKDRICL